MGALDDFYRKALPQANAGGSTSSGGLDNFYNSFLQGPSQDAYAYAMQIAQERQRRQQETDARINQMQSRSTGPSAHSTSSRKSVGADDSFLTRAKKWGSNVVGSALTGVAGSIAGRDRTLYELGQANRDEDNAFLMHQAEERLRAAQEYYDQELEKAGGDETANRYVRNAKDALDAAQKYYDDMSRLPEIQRGATEATHELANEAQSAATRKRETAKAAAGNSWLGNIATDAAISSVERATDRLSGVALGGGLRMPASGAQTLLPMMSRVFGSGATEAKNYPEQLAQQEYNRVLSQGGTAEEAQAAAQRIREENQVGLGAQVAYGGASAALEGLTEVMFDGLAGIYGEGEADVLVEQLVRRLATTDAGRSVLRTIANMGGEGVEEIASGIVSPLLQSIYTGKSVKESYQENFNVTDLLYDALVGAFAAGISNVTNPVSMYQQNQAKNEILRTADTTESILSDMGYDRRAARQGANAAISVMSEDNGRARQEAMAAQPLSFQDAMRQSTRQMQLSQDAGKYGKTAEEIAVNRAKGLEKGFRDMGVTESEAELLTKNYDETTQTSQEYTQAVREAHFYGAQGLSLEQTKEQVQRAGAGRSFASGMNEKQLESAWWTGNRVHQEREAASAETVDTATEEGKAKLGARLASLGVNADAAVDAYESTQDVRKYAAEMNTAVALASAGADIAAMQQRKKSEGKTGGLAYLTDAQIAVAAEIGAKMQSQRQQLAKQKSAKFTALRERIAEGRMPADMQQSLKEVRNYLGTLQQDIRSLRDGLQEMIAADPAAKETATYKAIEERIREKEADAAEARDLIEKIKAAGGEAAGPRKGRKGRMVYAKQGGTEGGVEYKAVDRSKLSRTQKSAARVAEVIARVSGLNIMLADFGKGIGGEYFRGTGGTVYLNINASFNGKNITVASMTHELTHFLQEYAPEQYEELKDFVLQEMAKNPEEFEIIFRTRMGRQQNLTPDQLTDEMVANACMTVLQDDAAVQRIVREHQTLAERIRDFILKFVDDLKSAFSEIDTKDNFTLYREVRAAEGALDEIRERWVNAFTVAAENLQNEAETKNTAPKSGEMGMQTLYIEGRDSTIKKEPSSSAVGDNLQPTSKTTEGLAPVNTIPEAAENVNMNDPVALEEFAEPAGVQYSIFVEDPETLQWLDEQEKAGKVVTTYKSFLEIDGKLYPPMASMKKDENGKWKMTKAMEAGRWEESVGDPSKVVVDPKNGRGYYILKKDNGDTVKAAYNPYQHSSNLMLNDQFTGAYDRPKLVTYECIIPESELTSGYRAQYAKDAVGVHSWKAGPVAGKLVKAKGTERQVYLSRWLKPVRKVPDAEVAQHYKKLLDGTDIAVPSNVVPPSLLEALEDAGVRIQYTKQAPKRERTTTEDNGQMKMQLQAWEELTDEEKQAEINASMTMEQARTMVQKAFAASGIKEWYDGEYQNGDEWLKDRGIDEVAMHIENEYVIADKYLYQNPRIINDDYNVYDILDAYLNGTLTGKTAKKGPKARVDTSKSTGYQDNRFYAPGSVEVTPETWNTANARATKSNQQEVNEARKNILFAAHNGDITAALGITKAELNKKLRQWSRYSSQAREASMRINSGVAPENQWTGIQNSSILNGMTITDEEIRSMVKDVNGESTEYERKEIGNVMLALDTHIDWSWLSFNFKHGNVYNERPSVRGLYEDSKRKVTIGRGYQNTVSHEMGHALDYQWERELFVSEHTRGPLSENNMREDLIRDDDGRTFYRNFRDFVYRLQDVNSNYNSYTMEPTEVFARFVAKFVEWTQKTAGAYVFEENYYRDNFNTQHFIEFAQLLQEKAALDAKWAQEGQPQMQTWQGDQAMLDEFSDIHPDFQRRIDEANELTEDLVKYFRNVTGENALEEDEIRELMEQNLYNRQLRGDIPDSAEILETLSKISQVKNGKGRMQAFELMERILPHLDESTQQLWISRTEENRNEAFAKWYNKKHPSLYYPGYQPGDLFKNGTAYSGTIPWGNLHKERGYLHKLINSGELVEPELSMAKDFLARLMKPNGEVFYQQWDDAHNDWAPTFYSQMQNVVNEWTNEKGRPMPAKMAANAVIPWLRGRGVKAEEIRWSGLQPWLEGRKSVTQEELQAFMAENQTQIKTKVLRSDLGEEYWSMDGSNFTDFDKLMKYATQLAEDEGFEPGTVDWEPVYYRDDRRVIYGMKDGEAEPILYVDKAEGGAGETQWFDYSTEGGTNYREILFKMPGLNYTNNASRTHWGSIDEDVGTIAHARIQDIEDTGGRRVLFIEEIQSDLHNAGARNGYGITDKTRETINRLKKRRDDAVKELNGIEDECMSLSRTIYERLMNKKTKYDFSVDSIFSWVLGDNLFPVEDENALSSTEELWGSSGEVLSVMTEEDRDKLRDAQRISRAASDLKLIYDAEVKKSEETKVPDVPFAGSADTYHEYVMKHLLREAAEGGYDGIGWTPAEMQSDRWSDQYAEGYRIEYDQNIPKFMRKYLKQWGGKVETTKLGTGDEVWYASVNDEMRKSILEVGQPMYQQWDDTYDDTEEEESGRWEAYSRMQAEQAILDEALTGVRELTKKEKKTIAEIQKRLRIGKDPEVRMKDARKLAKQLITDQNSTADIDEIAADIKYMGDYLLQSGDPTTTVLSELARETAYKIASTAEEVVDDNEAEVFQNIRSSIKGAKITVDPAEAGDIGGVESLNEFRKQNFGRFTVVSRDSSAATKQGYISVEQLYDDLHGEFGDHYFPEAGSDNGPANGGEMLRIIADMYDAAEPMTVNPNEQYMGEAVESIAHDITFAVLNDALQMEPLTMSENVRAELLDTETGLPQKTRQQAADLLKQGEELEEANRELQVKEKQATARAEALQAKNEGLEARNRQIRKDALQAAADQKQQNQESAAEIRRLQSEVKQMSKKLDKATARYKTLQDDARERVARVRREGTARAQERAAKERAKKYEKLAELKEHYQEMERAARERRHSSELRGKIRRLIDKLNAKLARPSEKKHVPRELVQLTVDVLKMIDVGARAGVRMRDKLAQIRTMYESYEKNPTYSMVYDEQTAEMLKNLQEKIGDGNIYKMTESQLQAVYQTLKSLNHVIEEAVSIRIGDEERNAFEVAQEMTAETRAVPKAQKGWGRAKYLIAHLRPDVAFRRFAWFKKNSTWESMARMLNDGQLKQTGIQMKLSRPFAELINNGAAMRDFMGMNAFGRVDPDKLIDIGLEDKDGKTIKVTHGIALGIWFDLQNEQNKKHFIRGGKTIPNLNDYYGGKGGFKFETQRSKGISTELSDLYHQIREAKEKGDDDLAEELKDRVEMVKLSGENYADKVRKSIEDQMTDFDRAWIRETQHLMNVEAKRYLNETTMEVYGIEKAGVDNYYPITSDPNFLSTPFESITKNMNLENAGFMKERIESGNPTLALDVSSVVNDQIRRVAQYSGLMPAIRNFNKVYNKMSYGYSDSLKKALNDKFGDAGTGYIEDLIADLTGSRNEGEDSLGINRLLGSLRGNLAQTTLTLNLRVAMSQAASYPTAAAELGWKPLAKALRKGGKDGRMISRADQELIATYSPLLWLRMQGYSTVELGDIKNSQKLMARFWKKMRWATGWIQAVDGATVGRLWSASEYWVDDHMPYLQKGSDEYYQEVAKKFNDVVEKTQPNYTTMQRPAMLRDPRGIVKMVTMFMTQRLQNFNLIFDSTAAYQKARADLAAKRNGVTEADVKEAKTQMVLAVTSQLAQAATFVAFKFIADALLRNLKGYRDDEDGELTAQSISMQILDNYVDAMMGSFWLGSELYTIAKAVTGNEKWYGLSLSGVDSLNDLVDDIVAMLSEEHDLTTEKGRAKFMKKLASLAGSVAQAMGLPLNNAAKIGKAVAGHVEAAIEAESFSGYWDYGYEPTKAQQKVRTRKELGVSDKFWDRSQAADADSNGSITQDEIGAWLQQEIAAGSLTQEEAEALWKAHGSTWKKTFADWSGEAAKKAAKEAKAAATPAAAKTPEDDGYKTFKNNAPLYGSQKRDASYAVWEKYLKPNGMSIERFLEILGAADADLNESLTQDELGYALRGAIRNREMTDAQASAVWNAQGWKRDFWYWNSKH